MSVWGRPPPASPFPTASNSGLLDCIVKASSYGLRYAGSDSKSPSTETAREWAGSGSLENRLYVSAAV